MAEQLPNQVGGQRRVPPLNTENQCASLNRNARHIT